MFQKISLEQKFILFSEVRYLPKCVIQSQLHGLAVCYDDCLENVVTELCLLQPHVHNFVSLAGLIHITFSFWLLFDSPSVACLL